MARSAILMWNKIPPAPFSKGGETPGSCLRLLGQGEDRELTRLFDNESRLSYSPFNKGGQGDFEIDFVRSRSGAPAGAEVSV